ncbi:MAG: polysaccharide biosynthesis C-terminal domain-containing protein [Chitinophagales bacterium]
MPVKRFLKSAFLISAGGMLPLLSSFVLLIPFTSNLNTSDYGALAIYISFSLLVQFLMNFGIDTYMSVHYYDYKNDRPALKKFVGSLFGLLFLIGIILITVFCIGGKLLFDVIFQGGEISFFPYGFMSVLTAFFNAIFRTYVNLQVFSENSRRYFLFGLFNFIVTVAISTLLVYKYPFTLIGPMWGRLLSGILIFILSIAFVFKEYGITYSKNLFSEIKNYCFPLVIFSVLTWALAYFNNFILNAMETTTEVGIYDFALKCALLIEFGGLGLLSSINPRVYQLWKSNALAESTPGENRYHHIFSSFNILFIALNIVVIPVVVKLFVHNESYYASIELLPFIFISFAFRGLYNLFSNPLIYYKKTKALPRVLFISAVIQIISAILLVKYFGIWGAVWSYIMIKPVQVFFLWLESRRVFRFRFNMIKMIIIPVVYCVTVILIWEYTRIDFFYKGLLQLAVALILVGSVYPKEIIGIRSILRK